MPVTNLVGQEEVSQQFMGGVLSLFDIKENIIKRMSQLRGNFMKSDSLMGFPVSVFREEVTDNKRDKNSEESSKRIFTEFKEHWSFLLGLITAPFWYLIFRSIYLCIFGQRLAEPSLLQASAPADCSRARVSARGNNRARHQPTPPQNKRKSIVGTRRRLDAIVGRAYLKYRGQNVLHAQLQPFCAEAKM
jgi:hypothetical protein